MLFLLKCISKWFDFSVRLPSSISVVKQRSQFNHTLVWQLLKSFLKEFFICFFNYSFLNGLTPVYPYLQVAVLLMKPIFNILLAFIFKNESPNIFCLIYRFVDVSHRYKSIKTSVIYEVKIFIFLQAVSRNLLQKVLKEM